MQYLLVAEQTERADQANQSEIMVTMQMGNENMRDAATPYLIVDQLDLGALATIHQVIGAIERHHLAGWVAVEGRYGGIITQNSDCKHE